MNIALWTAMYITLRNQRQIAEAEEEHRRELDRRLRELKKEKKDLEEQSNTPSLRLKR